MMQVMPEKPFPYGNYRVPLLNVHTDPEVVWAGLT